MAFDPDEFLATTPTQGGFDPDKFLAETPPNGYWSDVAENAKEGLKEFPGMVRGMADMGSKLSPMMLPIRAAQSGYEVFQGKPITETPIAESAKAAFDLAKGVVGGTWEGIKDTGSVVKAPFEWLGGEDLAETDIGKKFRERPFGVPLGVAGTVALGASGLKALRGAKGAAGAGAIADDAAKAGIPKEAPIPGKGPIPEPEIPPLSGGPKTPPPPGTPPPIADPIKEVRDYISSKYGEQAAKSGRIEGTGRYLQNLSQDLGTKDIGLQPRQIASMGEGFQGLEKAEMLVDYAREQGYFKPTLTDVARKAKIKQVMETTGKQVEAVRSIGDKRGVPPLAEMRQELQTQLGDKFGIDAPREIKKVLAKFDKVAKENPTFSGMSELATELNKAKTPKKGMSQHPGPTTDGANIISRLNNDALRAVLNPQEAELYTKALRDFGAHKKLENAVAAAGRRSASARSNQRGLLSGLLQQALDRGGYRVAGNITHGLGKRMIQTPEKFKTLPKFFEELAHEAGDVFDDLSEGPPQYAHGGIVGEMDEYLTPRYGGQQ